MTKIVARCTPKRYYWFVNLLWLFVFGYGAVIVRGWLQLLGFNFQRSAIVLAWLSVTAIFLAWSYTRAYCRLFYTLSDDALFVGRGSAATVIPFAEIESIVLGLPDHRMTWWLRRIPFEPYGYEGVYEAHRRARENTILLRLTKSRYLPLNLTFPDLANGEYLMSELLDRNQSKIVERETYTKREIQRLSSPQYNTITTIDRNG
jgi:hypothetical protein